MSGRNLSYVVAFVLAWAVAAAKSEAAPFTVFETGHVRPLALSGDGTRLYAVNTPDNRLEIFSVDASGLANLGSVDVGLEPCSVALRDDSEAWVVNHLSDSVSIIDLAANPPRLVRTLLVGDEPRDIVFGGSSGNRAFITTAHRGQNTLVDPQLSTPGVGRADVWVFEATQSRHRSRRFAAHDSDAFRRHAAAAGGQPGRQHGVRGNFPFRQPDYDGFRRCGLRYQQREHQCRSGTGGMCRRRPVDAGRIAATPSRRRRRRPTRSRTHRQVRRSQLAR